MKKTEKNCLFQYATRDAVVEDTELITLEEAKGLWEKYLPDLKKRWHPTESPQMCIWIGCESNTDYSDTLVDIDFRDCELSGDRFYRVCKREIELT